MTPIARCLAAALVFAALATDPALAWTPTSQQSIAEHAARLAPPDLHRQLARNRRAFLQGALDAFGERDPNAHSKNADGSGHLDKAIATAINNAIRAITTHQPFEEICYRLGIVSHFVADANNPLNTARSDREESRYYADFLSYMESVEPRIEIVFYGFRPRLETHNSVAALLDETFKRSRGFYPAVGREYRRVKFQSGLTAFDDRSTAYAIAGLAYSHAVSDIAEALRYIWLRAGGIDTRRTIPIRGRDVVRLPRQDPSQPAASFGR